MLTVYLCVAMLAVVAVTGGSLPRLAALHIRHAWLLWVALADQVLVISVVPDWNPTLLALAHIGSYLAAGCCLAANRRLPGLLLVGLGGALNGLVITLNGGTLPASPAALRAAGVEHTGQFTNSAQLADARLPMLGDVFATPAWLPGHNVFSIGDVAIWVGLGWFLWRTCRPPQRLSRHRVPGPLYTGRHVNPGWHDLPGRHRSAWSVQLPRPARLTWPRVA